ncbi:MAG: MBL fold metallo-hydrolase [Clostridia bacterium]|nr:MBL fold metallo-hydrolase [Clostridia bacterium]MBR6966477.1 MBL fold metallo-hydrolase [Clostridia bacterium]
MEQNLLITHYYHSGFSVASKHTLAVFDYWRGERGELAPDRQIAPEKLAEYDNVFVFISHEHIDHLDPVVFTWADAGNVSYIVSSDMPVGTRGKRMAPGDTLKLSEELTVTAFDSTDLGVSFLADFCGIRVFHAGDLNFWHWREESTMQEIEEADAEFRKAVQPISKEQVDVAFFPVDPRQGTMYEAGANYFILAVKPRILIPMHYFHRADTAVDYARTASCRTTEVIALPGYGDSLRIGMDEEGYLNVSFPSADEAEKTEAAEEQEGSGADSELPLDEAETMLSEDDPFLESDLPVTSLADEENNDPPA